MVSQSEPGLAVSGGPMGGPGDVSSTPTGWATIPEIDLPEIFWLNSASENLFVEIPRHAR